MVEVSIISLIYRSCKLADWVYDSLMEFTPMLKNGKAEFFFIANDPTDELLNHLIIKGYPFYVNYNKACTENELFLQGYGKPEYMNRVYRGYNQGILNAKGFRIVLINSDNYFSPDWLENLMKYSEYKNVVTSTLVEPGHPKFHVFPGAYHANFGNSPDNFKKDEFLKYSNKVRKTGVKFDGAYMPCLFYKDAAMYAGLYPEGNIAGKTFDDVVQYGDENFYEKLSKLGILHITSLDSIVYHLKEGEKDDVINTAIADSGNLKLNSRILSDYGKLPSIELSDLNTAIRPTINHNVIIKKLLMKVSVIIPISDLKSPWKACIESVIKQSYNKVEIIAINDGCDENILKSEILTCFGQRVRYFSITNNIGYGAINLGIKEMTGEYFFWIAQNDILLPNKIQSQVDMIMRLESNNVVLFSDYTVVDKDNNFIKDVLYSQSKSNNGNYIIDYSTFLFPKHIVKNRGVKYKYIYVPKIVVKHIDCNE